MTAYPAVRVTRDMGRILGDAVDQARTAYELVPNNYTYSCLSACLAAERALGVLREAMENNEERLR